MHDARKQSLPGSDALDKAIAERKKTRNITCKEKSRPSAKIASAIGRIELNPCLENAAMDA